MCVLKIYSKSKSFKGIAALTRLPVYSIHDKGEVRRKRTGELYDSNRVSLDVSDAEWDEFPVQTKDAIKFLKENREALTELLQSAGDIDAFLDFPLWSRLSDEIVNQNDQLPRELIALAGELGLGIGMSIYAADAFNSVSEATTEESQQNRVPGSD